MRFFYIFRFDISDQMAAALANGFLTDFGVLRADSPAQQRIDPQEIAREKVRVSTKLEQERNADIHSGNQSVNHLDAHSVNQSINQLDIQSVNQSISQLETCVERTVVEDHGTLIKLEQEGNADIHRVNRSISQQNIKVEENVVEDSGTLTSLKQEGNSDIKSVNQLIDQLDIKVEETAEEDMLTFSGNSWYFLFQMITFVILSVSILTLWHKPELLWRAGLCLHFLIKIYIKNLFTGTVIYLSYHL